MSGCLHDVRVAERQRDVQATFEVARLPPSPVQSGCCHGPGTDAQELPRGPRGAAADVAGARKGDVPESYSKGLDERLEASGATHGATGFRDHSDGRRVFQRQLGRKTWDKDVS